MDSLLKNYSASKVIHIKITINWLMKRLYGSKEETFLMPKYKNTKEQNNIPQINHVRELTDCWCQY